MTTIAFCTTSLPLSGVIRWFTKSPCSHVVIGFEVFGVPVILQADIGGVQIALRGDFLKRHILVEEYAVVPDIVPGVQAAMHLLGERYNYVGLLGYAPVMVGRWFGKRFRNPFRSTRSVVCSELVAHLNDTHLLPEWNDVDPEDVAPADLLDRCRKGSSFRRVA